MKFVQYTYKNFSSGDDKVISIGSDITDGAVIRHLGIQIPYRPFISFRHDKAGMPYNNGIEGPCPTDIIITDANDSSWSIGCIINAPGILEFDDVSLGPIYISFPLNEDEASNPNGDKGLVFREVIVEAAIG